MKIEKAINRSWYLTLANLVTWTVWSVSNVLVELGFIKETSELAQPFNVFQGVAALIWLVMFLVLAKHWNTIGKDEVLSDALNDDFMKLAQHQASKAGFFGSIITASVCITVHDFFVLSGTAVAWLVVLGSVCMYFGSWLYFLKRGEWHACPLKASSGLRPRTQPRLTPRNTSAACCGRARNLP